MEVCRFYASPNLGDRILLTRNQLISRWKAWINHNRTHSRSEMEEMESHLWHEIEDLIRDEELSEEEAFQKVVIRMGDREALDQQFDVSNPLHKRITNWAKLHPWRIVTVLVCFLLFFGSDFLYSSNHTRTKMLYTNQFQFFPLTSIKNQGNHYLVENFEFPNSSNSSKDTKLKNDLPFFAILEKSNLTSGLYSTATIVNKEFTFVLDPSNLLWIATTRDLFTYKPNIINPEKKPNYTLNQSYQTVVKKQIEFFQTEKPKTRDIEFIFKGNLQALIPIPEIIQIPKNQNLSFYTPNDGGKVRTFRFQILCLEEVPYYGILCDEVFILEKPAHLWSIFF
jgi:hypothetical protein